MTANKIKFPCMKIKFSSFLIIIFLFSSCASRERDFIPVPDEKFFERETTIGISINDIIETKSGHTVSSMPEWLAAFLEGGIEAVESIYAFRNKYVYIASNKGASRTVLNKWAETYTTTHDFRIPAAERIERRVVAASTLYPDNEFGQFNEKLIKTSFNTSYPGVHKQDIYWITINEDNESAGTYIYFILLTIDKSMMQMVIKNLLSYSVNNSVLTNPQAAAVNRLRQNFFEGF